MDQDQNNLNQNNFNVQGNNEIPNNQPLQNNQSLNNIPNQNVNVNQTTFNGQQLVNTNYQQPKSQTNIQQPTPQPVNNSFENGNANNHSFNSKLPKKMNLGLIIGIVTALVVTVIGGVLLISNMNDNTNNNTSNGNSNSENNNVFFTIDDVEIRFPCTLKEIIEKTGYGISMINDDYRNINLGIKGDSNIVCLAKEDKWFEVRLAENKDLRIIDEQVIGFENINDDEHFPKIKLMNKWGVGDSVAVDEVKSIINAEKPIVDNGSILLYSDETFDYFSVKWKEDNNIISEIGYRVVANYDNYKVPTYKQNNSLDNVQITLDGNKLDLPVDLNSYGTNTKLYIDKHISRHDLDNGMTYAFDLTHRTSSTMLFNGWEMGSKLSYDDIVKTFGEPFSIWEYDLTGKTFLNEEKDLCVVYVTENAYLCIITRNNELSFLSFSKL